MILELFNSNTEISFLYHQDADKKARGKTIKNAMLSRKNVIYWQRVILKTKIKEQKYCPDENNLKISFVAYSLLYIGSLSNEDSGAK